jgi:Phospholipid methyltransferase
VNSIAYGVALMAGSVMGIFAALLNQVMMIFFYFLIEKPHIKTIFSSKPIHQ